MSDIFYLICGRVEFSEQLAIFGRNGLDIAKSEVITDTADCTNLKEVMAKAKREQAALIIMPLSPESHQGRRKFDIDMEEVERLRKAKKSYKAIAQKYGVARMTLYRRCIEHEQRRLKKKLEHDPKKSDEK